MSKYTTGEMAKLCGVSVRTVQYYDTRDILIPSEITDGGRRVYSEADLNKLKTICQLRELGMPINSIARILAEKNNEKVVSLILAQQEKTLRTEIEERKTQLQKLEALQKTLNADAPIQQNDNGDIAHETMKNNNLKKLHTTLLLTGLPLGILQWTSIILWITNGLWWLFVVWAVIAIPYAIWISAYYFKRVAYICPECQATFKPKLKEAFWANHTPKTRKLVCPHCNKKSFCVETYHKN